MECSEQPSKFWERVSQAFLSKEFQRVGATGDGQKRGRGHLEQAFYATMVEKGTPLDVRSQAI